MEYREAELVETLTHILAQPAADDVMADYTDEELEIRDFVTFREAGLLTSDQGLVLTLSDGSEFQITVVKSR